MIFAVLVRVGLALLTVNLSAEEPEAMRFELPAGELAAVLGEFNEQSGRQIVAPTQLVQGVRTHPVTGEFTPAVALEGILVGTPLIVIEDSVSGAFAVVRRTAALEVNTATKAEVVIIVGLVADDAQAERFWAQANAAREAFVARGIPAAAVRVLPETHGATIRARAIQDALRGDRPSVQETWVLLLGNIAPGRDGEPMFQVNGPRLSAKDFAAAVAMRPGRRCVVVGAARSGGFLVPLLDLPDIDAVAATTASGELNEPRFVTHWLEALRARPRADFDELATIAAADVAKFYRERKLAQTEHAQIIDRSAGEIVPVIR